MLNVEIMNIAVFTQGYPDRDNPSLTPFIKDHSVALSSYGNRVCVLYVSMTPVRKWFSHGFCRVEHTFGDGIELYKIRMRYVRGLNRVNTFVFGRKMRKLYKRALTDGFIPDAAVSHFFDMAGYTAAKIADGKNLD